MVASPRIPLLQHHRLARPLVILLSVSAITSVLYLAPAPTQHSHLVESIRVRWKLNGLSLRSGYLPRIPLDDLVRLSRNIPRVRQSTIPKLIHQSYKDTTLPNDFKDYQKSWSTQHPSWIYQFWTDEDNRQLVSTHFPWFLDTYDNLPQKIMRPDAARYMYMYLFGGVYADLDMEALQPLDPLLAHRHAALAWMGPADDHPHNLPNAWMASEPGHPFWLMMLMHIMQCPKDQAAEHVTGPGALKGAYFKYWLPTNQTSLSIVEPGLIYPHDWARGGGDVAKYCGNTFGKNPTFDASKCKEIVMGMGAYTVTYWRHSWDYNRRLLRLS